MPDSEPRESVAVSTLTEERISPTTCGSKSHRPTISWVNIKYTKQNVLQQRNASDIFEKAVVGKIIESGRPVLHFVCS